MTNSGKMVSTSEKNCTFQIGGDQVSGGVSILCWLAALVANVVWKPQENRKQCQNGNKV